MLLLVLGGVLALSSITSSAIAGVISRFISSILRSFSVMSYVFSNINVVRIATSSRICSSSSSSSTISGMDSSGFSQTMNFEGESTSHTGTCSWLVGELSAVIGGVGSG